MSEDTERPSKIEILACVPAFALALHADGPPTTRDQVFWRIHPARCELLHNGSLLLIRGPLRCCGHRPACLGLDSY
jgi:hypothetical protein